jgi:hypothetical protein
LARTTRSAGSPRCPDDDTVAAQAQEVLYGIDLTAWGWFWLIVGLVQVVTGVLILQRNMWGLWLGVGIACASALMTVLVFPVVGDRGAHDRLPGALRAADRERRIHGLTAGRQGAAAAGCVRDAGGRRSEWAA